MTKKAVRDLSPLLALVLLCGPATVRNLHAQATCTNATFSGRYVYSFSGFALQDAQGQPGQSFLSAVGSTVADGRGKLTLQKDTINTLGAAAARDYSQFVAGDSTYTVGSDCRGTINYTVALSPDQRLRVETPFVLSNGGSEGWFMQSTPPTAVISGFFRRVDAGELAAIAALESKIDDLVQRVDAIKRLLDRVALAHSIIPR